MAFKSHRQRQREENRRLADHRPTKARTQKEPVKPHVNKYAQPSPCGWQNHEPAFLSEKAIYKEGKTE